MTTKSFTRLAIALAICAHVTHASAQATTDPAPKEPLRIQAGGLGTTDWQAGTFITGQGCTMVKLDRPSPAGYSSLLLSAIGRLQALRLGRWVDVVLAPLLKKEAAHCLGEGSDWRLRATGPPIRDQEKGHRFSPQAALRVVPNAARPDLRGLRELDALGTKGHHGLTGARRSYSRSVRRWEEPQSPLCSPCVP